MKSFLIQTAENDSDGSQVRREYLYTAPKKSKAVIALLDDKGDDRVKVMYAREVRRGTLVRRTYMRGEMEFSHATIQMEVEVPVESNQVLDDMASFEGREIFFAETGRGIQTFYPVSVLAGIGHYLERDPITGEPADPQLDHDESPEHVPATLGEVIAELDPYLPDVARELSA